VTTLRSVWEPWCTPWVPHPARLQCSSRMQHLMATLAVTATPPWSQAAPASIVDVILDVGRVPPSLRANPRQTA
jgi:hypothetical protein